RHRIVARDGICLHYPAVAAATSDRQDAVTPIFHSAWALDSRRNSVCELNSVCTAGTSRHGVEFHPIWYATSLTPPYIAVNEDEGGQSSRSGRDSSQTCPTR